MTPPKLRAVEPPEFDDDAPLVAPPDYGHGDAEVVPKWQHKLLWTKPSTPKARAHVKNNVANAVTIFANHDEWDGVLAYDEFAQRIVTTRVPPWAPDDCPSDPRPGELSESDTTRAQGWLSRRWDIDLSPDAVYAALSIVAERNRVHPVRAYLESLEWDGNPRVETFLRNYFGVAVSPYSIAVGTCFLIGCVARVMRPGCKLDTMVVLEGEQGTYKSTALRALASDPWFVELTGELGTRDVAMQLRSKWIVEFGELASLRRSEIETVKAFLSRPADNYRAPYGRLNRDYPRQCAFAGTTNPTGAGYLQDPTGARRFLPVRCGQVDIRALCRDRDQIWAEAKRLFDQGALWYFTSTDLKTAAQLEQAERFAEDVWLGQIAEWLSNPLRRSAGVTILEIATDCLKIESGRVAHGETIRIGNILRVLKWWPKKEPRSDGRVRVYRPDVYRLDGPTTNEIR